MVPIKEMTDVLKVIKETAVLKAKQWVRLKRGVFKDDLGQVSTMWSFNLIINFKTFKYVFVTKIFYFTSSITKWASFNINLWEFFWQIWALLFYLMIFFLGGSCFRHFN